MTENLGLLSCVAALADIMKEHGCDWDEARIRWNIETLKAIEEAEPSNVLHRFRAAEVSLMLPIFSEPLP